MKKLIALVALLAGCAATPAPPAPAPPPPAPSPAPTASVSYIACCNLAIAQGNCVKPGLESYCPIVLQHVVEGHLTVIPCVCSLCGLACK